MFPQTVIDDGLEAASGSVLGVREGHGVGPFLAERLDVDEVGRRP